MLVVGLTGTKSSGKGEVAEFLKKKGFFYYSLSDIVREEAKKRGLEKYTVKDLQDIGNEFRKKYGLGVLAERIIKKIRIEKKEKYVIDGIRNPGEIKKLDDIENFYLIAVDAPKRKRYQWLLARARASDPKTWQEFLKMDARDRGDGELNIGQQVGLCMNMANFYMMNDASIESLHKKVDKILAEII